MEIDLLKNHRRHVPTLAGWFREEWPDHFEGRSLDSIAEEQFVSRLNDGFLPVSLIAHVDGSPVGTVALLTESVSTHKHLAPWLGGLYVCPDHRHGGFGSRLVRAGIRKASDMGFERVYAGVGGAEGHYLSMGWEVLERVIYCGQPLSVLRYDLINGRCEDEKNRVRVDPLHSTGGGRGGRS